MVIAIVLLIIGIFLITIAIAAMASKVQQTKEVEVQKSNEGIKMHEIPKQKRLEEGLIKRMKFPVVGLNYENRKNTLKKIINQYKKEEFFYEKYDGLKNKEIIEDYFTDKIYELTAESLRDTVLEREDTNEYDSNALKVMIKDVEGKHHHIGYVPKEYCAEIRKLWEEYKILVGASITGGKYKIVDYDDYGNEKVKIKDSDYGLKLSVSFWQK